MRMQVNIGDKFNYWEVIETDILNPDSKNKSYLGKPVFSKVKCTCCNESERIVPTNQLKQLSQKCRKCTLIERNRKDCFVKIGQKYGRLTIVGDGGFKTQSNGKRRHFSICNCDCGNTNILVKDNSLQQGNTTSCGCILSKGEEEIKSILLNNNILFKTNCEFKDLTEQTKRRLRFDFIIYNDDGSINRFIEFDGNQHKTGMWGGSWSNIEDFETIHERDLIKNNYCLENNYILIRIPYNLLGKITYEDLFSNKYEVK